MLFLQRQLNKLATGYTWKKPVAFSLFGWNISVNRSWRCDPYTRIDAHLCLGVTCILYNIQAEWFLWAFPPFIHSQLIYVPLYSYLVWSAHSIHLVWSTGCLRVYFAYLLLHTRARILWLVLTNFILKSRPQLRQWQRQNVLSLICGIKRRKLNFKKASVAEMDVCTSF